MKLGHWVVFPEPVSPATTTSNWQCILVYLRLTARWDWSATEVPLGSNPELPKRKNEPLTELIRVQELFSSATFLSLNASTYCNISQPCLSTLSHALPITPHDWKPLTGPLLPARKHGLAAGPFSPQWLSPWNISNLGLAANSPDTIPRRAKGLRLRTSTSATLINSQYPRNTVPFQLFDIVSGFSMQEKRIEWLTNLQVENTQHLHSEILVSFGQIQHI
jgi:hypothetical protein